MKKGLLKAVAAVVVLMGIIQCVEWIDTRLNYIVLEDNSNLEECAVRFLQNGEPVQVTLKLHSCVDLGGRKICFDRLPGGRRTPAGANPDGERTEWAV